MKLNASNELRELIQNELMMNQFEAARKHEKSERISNDWAINYKLEWMKEDFQTRMNGFAGWINCWLCLIEIKLNSFPLMNWIKLKSASINQKQPASHWWRERFKLNLTRHLISFGFISSFNLHSIFKILSQFKPYFYYDLYFPYGQPVRIAYCYNNIKS